MATTTMMVMIIIVLEITVIIIAKIIIATIIIIINLKNALTFRCISSEQLLALNKPRSRGWCRVVLISRLSQQKQYGLCVSLKAQQADVAGV